MAISRPGVRAEFEAPAEDIDDHGKRFVPRVFGCPDVQVQAVLTEPVVGDKSCIVALQIRLTDPGSRGILSNIAVLTNHVGEYNGCSVDARLHQWNRDLLGRVAALEEVFSLKTTPTPEVA